MIDLEKCKKLFDNYVSNFNMNDEKINLKYYHTLRVMNFCEKIAISLNLSNSDIHLCSLIGLLHDLGRFEQVKIYNTFDDNKSVDHAQLAVQILNKDNYIDSFINDDTSKRLLLLAILNHNKYAIDNHLNEREVLLCKIIRDADKLDIFDIHVNNLYHDYAKNSFISDRIYEQIMECKPILSVNAKTNLDNSLKEIGMFFDLNFCYSYNYVITNHLAVKLIDSIITNNMNEYNKLNSIKDCLLSFLSSKN